MATSAIAAPRSRRVAAVLAAQDRRARRQMLTGACALAALLATLVGFGAWLSLTPAALIDGIGRIWGLLEQMVPIDTRSLGPSLEALWDTYLYAVAGTVLALVGSFVLALVAATPTTPHASLRTASRGLLAFLRAVPDLVFALIFVAALGLGPAAGVLALAVHSTGILARQFADAIEDLDPGPATALRAVGASRAQVTLASILPRIAPVGLGLTLFRLEINVRSSVVLGFVGAGGIGLLLQNALGTLRYEAAALYILEIMVLILVNERIAEALRARVSGRSAQREPGPLARRVGERARSAGRVVAWTAAVALGIVAFRASGLSVADVWTVPRSIADTLVQFTPHIPDDAGKLLVQLGQTFAIGFIAATIGYAIAVVMGIAAAGGIGGTFLTRGIGVVLALMRGVPELVLALVFVAAVGLGPTAGVLALIVATIAFGGKLVAEVVAEQERGAETALESAGATTPQTTAAATLPTGFPALTALGLFVLDVNVRASVVLGVVGAGGIGFSLLEALRTFDYHRAGFLLCEIFALVLVLEAVSVLARRRLGDRPEG